MRPIQTDYNGLRFRSRLEARWAVFFDAASIRYQYELEGYELEGGARYLPDFYLPDLDFHVEVKGTLREGDLDKILDAADELPLGVGGISLALLKEVPNVALGVPCHLCWRQGADGFGASAFRFTEGGIALGFFDGDDHVGPSLEVAEPMAQHYSSIAPVDRTASKAYHKARASRFEYGETPKAASR